MKSYWIIFSKFTTCFIGMFIPVHAGTIVTDGTVGVATTLTGPNYTISQDLGATVGNNLLHSFGTFNLSQGDVATFTGSDTIQNVITRITGNSPSVIDGTLSSTLANADFYFINPYGIIFGPNGTIDVKGGFYASTAQELRFADGSRYSATMPAGSSFTSASPEAFGFLGPSGAIQVNSSQLNFNSGEAVTLAGGSVILNGTTLTAPQSNLQIYSQGNIVGAVPVNGDLPTGNGTVIISASNLDVSGDGGGNISISGGDVRINEGSVVLNFNTDNQNANGSIKVNAGSLLINAGVIATTALAAGNAGDVVINVADHIEVSNGSIVGSETKASGNAGHVIITAGSLIIDGGEAGYAYVTSQTGSEAPNATGNAGNTIINVSGEIRIINGGQILDVTFAHGNSGMVIVNAGKLVIEGQGEGASTIVAGSGVAGSGDAGSTGKTSDIIIHVSGDIRIMDGGSITNNIDGAEHAGNIVINAGSLVIDSQGNNDYGTGISTRALAGSTGNAGNIVINVNGSMQLLNGGQVLSATEGQGQGGEIRISAGTLTINSQGNEQRFTGISSGTKSTGKAGNIVINVNGSLQILNGGQIQASTYGPGDAGTVTVNAASLIIDSQGFSATNHTTIGPTGITSMAGSQSTGQAGTINVNVNGNANIVQNGSTITSQNEGTGDAGQVNVNVSGRLNLTDSSITTAALIGNGGPIAVNTPILMINNGQITTTSHGSGNGGNIDISGKYLLMDTGFIQANTAQGAKGGDIFVDELGVIGSSGRVSVGGQTRKTFVANSSHNVIQAAAPDGVSGNITITSPDTSAAANLVAVADNRLNMRPITNPCSGHKNRVSLRIKSSRKSSISHRDCSN